MSFKGRGKENIFRQKNGNYRVRTKSDNTLNLKISLLLIIILLLLSSSSSGFQRPGCKDDHSPPFSAEVKNASWRGAQLKKKNTQEPTLPYTLPTVLVTVSLKISTPRSL